MANTSTTIAITGIRAYVLENSGGVAVGGANVFIRDMGIKQGESSSGDTTTNFWDFRDTDITGLTNGISYSARLAITDEAGNHMYLTTERSSTPDEVIGLLAEDLNCFIATAAYGSILDKRINTFRSFRNQVMNHSQIGKRLIQVYYKHGKKAADFIKSNNSLKFIVRTALWPALGFAHLSLKFGFKTTIFFSFLILLLLGLGLTRLISRRSNV